MAHYKRVSDNRWTISERIEVLEAFIERANESLQGRLFDDEDLSNPTGTVKFTMIIRQDKSTGKQTITRKTLELSDSEYNDYIQKLRPFILGEQDIFLPRIARQIVYLLRDEHKEKGEELVSWVETFVSFEKEFAPYFYQTFYKNPDGSGFSASNADLALDYIYGRAVKVDLDRRRNLKRVEEFDKTGTEIAEALNSFLKQLMRLVLVTKNCITHWHTNNFFIDEMQEIEIA